jgi:hypothetical protein
MQIMYRFFYLSKIDLYKNKNLLFVIPTKEESHQVAHVTDIFLSQE